MGTAVLALAPEVSCLVAVDPETGGHVLCHDGSPPAVMRARIDALVQYLLGLPGEKQELRVEHTLADGMYLRKLFIPKGAFVAGKIHLKPAINIVASGCVDILTEFGSRQLYAGFTGVSQPGIQKVAMAHEDTVFINMFRTDLTDIAEIEAEIATTERPAAEASKELVCL